MRFEGPPMRPGPKIGDENIEQVKGPERVENPIERGKSFLTRTREKLTDGIKTFFSVPRYDKLKNILGKTIGILMMAQAAKLTLDQSWTEFLPHNMEPDKMVFALATFGLFGATMVAATLLDQHNQRKAEEQRG